MLANNLFRSITLDSFCPLVPTDNQAFSVQHDVRVILHIRNDQPEAFLILTQSVLHSLALRDVADRCGHKNSFCALERAEHDLDRKLTPILPPTDQFKSGTYLLLQRFRGGARIVSDQPLREAFWDNVLHLLPNEFITPVSEPLLCLHIQQDDFAGLVHYHHSIWGSLQETAIPGLHLRQVLFRTLAHAEIAAPFSHQNFELLIRGYQAAALTLHGRGIMQNLVTFVNPQMDKYRKREKACNEESAVYGSDPWVEELDPTGFPDPCGNASGESRGCRAPEQHLFAVLGASGIGESK